MATNASLGYTSTFQMWDVNAGPAAYVTLAEVFAITPPSESSDTVDVTHMQSPDRRRETIAGFTDGGEGTVEMNFVPNSATDALIRAVRTAGNNVSCRITFPNAATWTFDAAITGYEVNIPVDDRMTATLTFAASGSVVVA